MGRDGRRGALGVCVGGGGGGRVAVILCNCLN